ncbi:MAG: DUF3443 family protein, partial [Terriglobales bacterium]
MWRASAMAALALAAGVAVSCGGGGGGSNNNGGGDGSPVANTVPVVSNLGINNDYADGVFTSVTVCAPGTSNCQTIDNVLVDTGSYGLRLLGSQVNLPLQVSKDANGDPLAECLQLSSSFSWGPVATADVQLAGETASNVPVQLLGQSGFAAPPGSCSNTGVPEADSQATLDANGILGIGVFRYDCGDGCTPPQSSIPPIYYGCPSSGCSPVLVSLSQEVQNPVALFAQDNNGVVLTFPQVPSLGALSVNGTLTFGIGTQSDNSLGSATVLAADNTGSFNTSFNSTTYSGSILDSGSNAVYFLDDTTLNIPLCASPNDGFYCPTSTVSYSATNTGASGTASAAAQWQVANALTLFNTGNAAFSNLGGP